MYPVPWCLRKGNGDPASSASVNGNSVVSIPLDFLLQRSRPLARAAAVWCKSFIISSLSIRKGLVLSFRAGSQGRVIHRFTAPTTWSLTTCSLLLALGSPVSPENQAGRYCVSPENRAKGVLCFTGENYGKPHKPVEIRDLGAQGAPWFGGCRGPTRRRKAADGPLRGRNGEISDLVGLD